MRRSQEEISAEIRRRAQAKRAAIRRRRQIIAACVPLILCIGYFAIMQRKPAEIAITQNTNETASATVAEDERVTVPTYFPQSTKPPKTTILSIIPAVENTKEEGLRADAAADKTHFDGQYDLTFSDGQTARLTIHGDEIELDGEPINDPALISEIVALLTEMEDHP